MSDTSNFMHHCLYFTSQALCRTMNRLAEEEFAPTGLAPSQTYLLKIVIDTPAITQKELGAQMQLAPSTITRFIDNLVRRNLVTKESHGKLVRVTATSTGQDLAPVIDKVWAQLYKRYSDAMGKEASDDLAVRLDAAVKALDQ